ncbi:hypothetical protein [Enterococcus ureasiticus]|uniref:Uncharacterized protein n=1 Tax=Enterococcus ureasiticus TaxID=903984 RepID=A0A1E5GCF3_9ENTE|nr:hypothetical protein [Enterococcus ureasiticus]OEG10416.1 hypothetical protein BCR21_13805 [Enterococcus ureasiticus]
MISILIFIFGVGKVYKDIKNKKDRQKQASGIMSVTEKYGSILFLIVIITRWIIGFLSGQDKKVSIIGTLFPLLIVILEVFLVEYSFGRVSTLVKLFKNQEYYRKEMGMSTKEWYGINSKEYKEELQN